MKKILFLMMCLIILAATAAAQENAPGKVLGVRQQLPNGLVWLYSEQHSLPLVSVKVMIKTGVLRDPAGKAGLDNLTALMLTQGTKQKSATQIAEAVDFLGAKLAAGGSDDFASVSLTVLKKNLQPGLDLLKDVLFNPAFDSEEVKHKVAQLRATFQTDEDEPGTVAARAFRQRLFGNNPYAHPAKGTPETLATIDRKDLAAFHDKFYRPNNAIVTLVGDLSPEEARDWVTKTFGDWKPGTIPELRLPAAPEVKVPEKIVIDKNITQANIIWGHLGITRDNPDFYAVQLLNYILGGGGFSSRLLDNIRENRGLAYSVASGFEAGLQPGAFEVSLETKNQSAREAVSLVLREVEQIRTKPVSDAELKDAKSYLIGNFPAKMDSVAKRAALMAYVEFYGLGLDYPGRYPSLIQNITAADLQKAADKYLHPDRYLLVVVGKKSDMTGFSSAATLPGDKETQHD